MLTTKYGQTEIAFAVTRRDVKCASHRFAMIGPPRNHGQYIGSIPRGPHMCLLADPSGGITSTLFCRCIPEFGSRRSCAPPRCEANAGALRAPPIPPPFPYPLPPFPNIPLGLTSGRMPAFHGVVKFFTVALAVASPARVCIPAIWLQPPQITPLPTPPPAESLSHPSPFL